MAELNILYLIVGGIALIAGLAMLAKALKGRGNAQDPKATAMLIGGMMVATFGLLLAAFWIAFATGTSNAEMAR
ncbi:MAG: hypothetical protein M3Q19_08895 [Pseudomonadota bacterium]|nr:hypothetical protein [Pseudomonadota bacterium]